MQVVEKDKIEELKLPGRIIQKAVGKDATVKSNKMTFITDIFTYFILSE